MIPNAVGSDPNAFLIGACKDNGDDFNVLYEIETAPSTVKLAGNEDESISFLSFQSAASE